MNANEFYALIVRPRNLNNDTLEEITQDSQKYPYCQPLRLMYLKNQYIINEEKFHEVVKKNSALLFDRKKLFEIIHALAKTDLIQAEVPAYSIESVYEKDASDEHFDVRLFSKFNEKEKKSENFIQNLESGEEEIEEVEKINIHETDDFITESLALVYVKTEKFEEAIKTYQKLCLKYPEKSSYFAAQIEKLNTKL